MKTCDLLDQAKQALGIESDYALAAKLDVSRSAISSYRKTPRRFDSRMCFKISKVLDLNPLLLIAYMELDRAECTSDEKCVNFWKSEVNELKMVNRDVSYHPSPLATA